MKRSLKIIYVLLIFASLLFLLQNVAFATQEYIPPYRTTPDSSSGDSAASSSGGWDAKSMINDAINWAPSDDGGISDATQNIVGSIITVIRIVGVGIAIIMTTYVAIKYMSAAPNEKAEFKKSATGLIVGAVVLFATTQILGLIADFATKNIPA